MKRKLLTLAVALVTLATTVRAGGDDFKKFEVQLGYGYFSYDAMMIKLSHTVDEWTQTFLQYYEIPKSHLKRYGDFNFGFRFRPSKKLMLGASLYWTPTSSDVFNRTYLEDQQPMKMGKLTYSILTPAIDLNIFYMSTEYFKLYGDFGVGYSLGKMTYTSEAFVSQKETPEKRGSKNIRHLNFQISPIGLKFGNRAGGFIEFGFGYRGLVNAGAFFNF